jgi:hypothetical protein
MKQSGTLGGRIRAPIFIGLVIVSVCTILVVLYGFRLANHASFMQQPHTRNRPKHHIVSQSEDDGKDELIEITAEDLAEFESAINSMKSTLKEIRSPMVNRRPDPLLAAHPNHRLIYHDLHKTDREHSVFVSLTSYYDTSCKETVRALFDNAKNEEDKYRIFIGAVQVMTPLPPHTTTLEPPKDGKTPPLATEPLPEHSFDSCLGDRFLTDCPEAPFCAADNVRVRSLPKEKWQGHAHARYLSISMYRSESFVLFLDRRASRVTFDWHNILEQEWLATSLAANNKRIVLTSAIPTVGPVPVDANKDHHHKDELFHRVLTCAAKEAAGGLLLPTIEAGKQEDTNKEAFIKSPLVSGSFVFGTSQMLLETLTDDTAWLNDNGRDWQLSAALYGSGWDAYATRKMPFATEKSVLPNANESSLESLHSSSVESANKHIQAFIEGRTKLIPVKAGGAGGIYSGNIMLDEDTVVPTPEWHRNSAEFGTKIAEKAMKGTSVCKEV